MKRLISAADVKAAAEHGGVLAIDDNTIVTRRPKTKLPSWASSWSLVPRPQRRSTRRLSLHPSITRHLLPASPSITRSTRSP